MDKLRRAGAGVVITLCVVAVQGVAAIGAPHVSGVESGSSARVGRATAAEATAPGAIAGVGRWAWGATRTVATSPSPATQRPERPFLTLSRDGRLSTLAWEENSFNLDGAISTTVVRTQSGVVGRGTTAWGPVTVLAEGANLALSQLVASGDGRHTIALITRYVDGRQQLQTRTATVTGARAIWGPVVTVASGTATSPRIALSGSGTRATLAWIRYDGRTAVVQSSSAVVGPTTSRWGATRNLTAVTSALSLWGPVSVAVSETGTRAVASWQRGSAGRYVVESRSATVTGTSAAWSRTVAVGVAGWSDVNEVAVSADGTRATVAWIRTSGTSTGGVRTAVVMARAATIRRSTVRWGAVTAVSAAREWASGADLALSATGTRITVAWTRIFPGNALVRGDVHARSAIVTGTRITWGPDRVLHSGKANGPSQVSLGLSRDGSRVSALWADYTPHGQGGLLTRSAVVCRATPRWGTLARLSPPAGYEFGYAIVVSAPGTRSVASWVRVDPTTARLQVRAGFLA